MVEKKIENATRNIYLMNKMKETNSFQEKHGQEKDRKRKTQEIKGDE